MDDTTFPRRPTRRFRTGRPRDAKAERPSDADLHDSRRGTARRRREEAGQRAGDLHGRLRRLLVGEEVQRRAVRPGACTRWRTTTARTAISIPDPDVEFYVVDDPAQPGVEAVYPIAIDHGPLGYHRYAELEGAGQISRVLNRAGKPISRDSATSG